MLKNKCALVTGSSVRAGIGYAIAQGLAAQGCNVMLTASRDPAKIGDIANTLAAEHGVDVAYLAADLTREADISGLIDRTVERFGAIDILVNNAGTNYPNPIETLAPAEWNEIIAINLSAAYHTIHLTLPGMKERGWGRIINVSSVLGLVGYENVVAYTASKHGLIGLTKTVALETAETAITCNAICPGFAKTDMLMRNIGELAEITGSTPEEMAAEMLERAHPSRTMVPLESIGGLAVFLCSEAAEEIRGAALTMDAGWSAR